MVDQRSLIRRAEAIVYVDDGNTTRAAIHHSEQRRKSAKVRPVTHARGHGDNRTSGKTPHHARQRALHARNRDDHLCTGDLLTMTKQAVYARNARIVHSGHAVAQETRCQHRFLGNGDIARASR